MAKIFDTEWAQDAAVREATARVRDRAAEVRDVQARLRDLVTDGHDVTDGYDADIDSVQPLRRAARQPSTDAPP